MMAGELPRTDRPWRLNVIQETSEDMYSSPMDSKTFEFVSK